MSTKRRKRHGPEEIVRKLRDADAKLSAGKELAAVLQALEVSESSYLRWRNQYGGRKAAEAVRLKKLKEENRRLKQLAAEKELGIQVLKLIAEGNWRVLLGSARRDQARGQAWHVRTQGLSSPEPAAIESTASDEASRRRSGVD